MARMHTGEWRVVQRMANVRDHKALTFSIGKAHTIFPLAAIKLITAMILFACNTP